MRQKPEEIEQTHGIRLVQHLGGREFKLGTTRAKTCHGCGATTRDFSTRQTPGISDVYFFLPQPLYKLGCPIALWWECKAPKTAISRGGKPSAEQVEFRDLCLERGIPHVLGPLDALIAFLVDGGWLRGDALPHYRQP